MKTANRLAFSWASYPLILIVVCILLLPSAGMAGARGVRQEASADFPVVDPLYIYNQLAYLTSTFQQREAGYVAGQGHDRFATYWAQEMARNLQGFGPQTTRDDFFVQGWRGRPASLPAFNMEVSIPGLLHPEQEVIVGCHYDGKANSSESAFDDTSGCAYELGVGAAMGGYWRSHHLYPERTIRFVIFDAEEQGLFGSFHYLNHTINGDLTNVTAMFNEEQSGINYPARYLGQLAQPFMPDYINLTPLQDNAAYPGRIHLSALQRQKVLQFRQRWTEAIPAVFAQFRAEGYSSLAFYDSQRQNSVQPIFTPNQQTHITIRDDPSSNSDQVPFIYAGLPVAMVTGDQSYYDPQPEPWAYPYDLPQDTLALMNTYTGGSSRTAPALALALALPAMFTTWMLNQPLVGGSVPGDGSPLAAIGDLGQAITDQTLALNASAFDPTQSTTAFAYTWNFGDGATATGSSVNHTYHAPGPYTLTLTVSSAHGTRIIRKTLAPSSSPVTYSNPYSPLPGDNRPNPTVKIPTPDSTLPIQPPLAAPFAQLAGATPTPIATSISPVVTPTVAPGHVNTKASSPASAWLWIVGLTALLAGLALLGGYWLVAARKRRSL